MLRDDAAREIMAALLFLLLFGPSSTGGGSVCEPIFNTTCANTATCAKSPYSGTGMACCPLADAVDCDTPLGNCCPKGHTCEKAGSGWEIVVTCKPAGGGAAVPGMPACKPGPLHRMSDTKKTASLSATLSPSAAPPFSPLRWLKIVLYSTRRMEGMVVRRSPRTGCVSTSKHIGDSSPPPRPLPSICGITSDKIMIVAATRYAMCSIIFLLPLVVSSQLATWRHAAADVETNGKKNCSRRDSIAVPQASHADALLSSNPRESEQGGSSCGHYSYMNLPFAAAGTAWLRRATARGGG